MGRDTDKLYITHSEHASQRAHSAAGAGYQKKTTLNFTSLPFTHCAISLQPFETPVCNSEGICYDLLNIIPYLRKHGKDPVSGKQLKPADLVRLRAHAECCLDFCLSSGQISPRTTKASTTTR
jgi:peptidyl-prolyl cis-trans isomerase-like protein 2